MARRAAVAAAKSKSALFEPALQFDASHGVVGIVYLRLYVDDDGAVGVSFFFSSLGRHTRSLCDWSSDVCSSDLRRDLQARGIQPPYSLLTLSLGGMAA